MADGGELVKLKMVAYKDEGFSEKAGNEFEVLINPSSYKHSYGIRYKENESMGDTAGAPKFEKFGGESASFKIVLDGTGVVPGSDKAKGVYQQLKKLKETAYNYNGTIHEPNYVQLLWGSMLFNGRLTSLSVEYNLFRPDGMPLRANVDLDFKGFTSKELESKMANKSSPDLSHLITVKAGDTLQKLCYEIYKDTAYCTEIAQINGLSGFRRVKPGTQLLFPPLRKNG
ncbi:MAG: hypothetical protein ACEPOZ_09360 [Marinifilaceae bacterium]